MINPYSSDYVKSLEERLAELEKRAQDPVQSEFYNSQVFQRAKQDCFLTFLLSIYGRQWQASDLGKEFKEYELKAFEEFKRDRLNGKHSNVRETVK